MEEELIGRYTVAGTALQLRITLIGGFLDFTKNNEVLKFKKNHLSQNVKITKFILCANLGVSLSFVLDCKPFMVGE